MKVELTGLEIKVEAGTLKLKIDEAKDLYMQLRELFGQCGKLPEPDAPVVVPYLPPAVPSPWTSPPNPITPKWPFLPTHPLAVPMADRPTITCQGQAVSKTRGLAG